METHTAPLIGGRYRIGGLLGEGGMARVFEAFDERLERPTAVKVLRAETRALPGMRQRFQQEALIAARLTHPHIVAVLDFGEDQSSSYLVMERLPGLTLRDEIVDRGPLPEGRVALVMDETLNALAAAHRCGVLHRDVKPSNILLQRDGHTKITDFGIAKSIDTQAHPAPERDDLTMTGIVLGTPGYLSPERRAGQAATVQSDLYAVGAVMVEALTGRRLGPEGVAAASLPACWRAVASRALAIDPRHRFASAGEMLDALYIDTARGRPAAGPLQASDAATATVQIPSAAKGDLSPAAGTALLRPAAPAPAPPGGIRTNRRRRRLALAWVALVVIAAASAALAVGLSRRGAPRANGPIHRTAASKPHAVTRPTSPASTTSSTTTTSTTDAVRAAIAALATSLANGGFPGDGALASALQSIASAPPGAAEVAAAAEALSLAGVLLDGGGISHTQYRDVVSTLQPLGAALTTPTTSSAINPGGPLQAPTFGTHGHGHDHGDGQG